MADDITPTPWPCHSEMGSGIWPQFSEGICPGRRLCGGTLVVLARQSAGTGRLARGWFSGRRRRLHPRAGWPGSLSLAGSRCLVLLEPLEIPGAEGVAVSLCVNGGLVAGIDGAFPVPDLAAVRTRDDKPAA